MKPFLVLAVVTLCYGIARADVSYETSPEKPSAPSAASSAPAESWLSTSHSKGAKAAPEFDTQVKAPAAPAPSPTAKPATGFDEGAANPAKVSKEKAKSVVNEAVSLTPDGKPAHEFLQTKLGKDYSKALGSGIADYTYELWLLRKEKKRKLTPEEKLEVRNKHMEKFDKLYNGLFPGAEPKGKETPVANRAASRKGAPEPAAPGPTAPAQGDIKAGAADLVDFNKPSK